MCVCVKEREEETEADTSVCVSAKGAEYDIM